jgi:hypothetical protein
VADAENPSRLALQEAAAGHPLDDGYRDSYSTSAGIGAEHHLDADALITALLGNQTRRRILARAAAASGRLGILDVGAGEGAKSRALATALTGHLGVEVVIYAVEPDPALGAQAAADGRVRWLRTTWEGLCADQGAGRLDLDPPPALALSLHSGYYVHPGLLASLVSLTSPGGLACWIVEAPGQLQDLKAFMQTTCGLGPPCGLATVTGALDLARIPYDPPVLIPNRSWAFDLRRQPGDEFADRYAFLLQHNHGSRPPTARDFRIAGRWLRDTITGNGQVHPDGTGWVDGPDALVIARNREEPRP